MIMVALIFCPKKEYSYNSHIYMGVKELMEMKEDTVLKFLPRDIRHIIQNLKLEFDYLQEIRLREKKPLILLYHDVEIIPGTKKDRPYLVTREDIQEMLEYISHYSLYAHEQDMKKGFITISGGHRAGLAGEVIVENGQVKNLRNVSSINLRLSHEIIGCADTVIPYITKQRNIYHTLIVSPPGCGKTTLLRDVIRQVSDGSEHRKGVSVGVVDERSEIGGCYKGVPQNNLGIRTDILDGCSKVDGMMMLIRSMNPMVVAVDEIGLKEDVHAVEYAMHCGCKILATAHAGSMQELRKRPLLERMIECEQFERYIVLSNQKHIGQIEGIYDSRGRILYREGI